LEKIGEEEAKFMIEVEKNVERGKRKAVAGCPGC
jgi:hypothetical protein